MTIDNNVIQARFDRAKRSVNHSKRMIWVKFFRENADENTILFTQNTEAEPDLIDNRVRFNIAIEAFRSEKEFESSQIKQLIEDAIKTERIKFNHKTCEMISDELYLLLNSRYPNRDIEITISNNAEDGVTIYYNKLQP